MVTVIFGQHGACDVDLAAANVGMKVDGAGHDHLPAKVKFLLDALLFARSMHQFSIADEQIPFLAIDLIGRIVDSSAG